MKTDLKLRQRDGDGENPLQKRQDGDEANYSPNHGFVFLRRKG